MSFFQEVLDRNDLIYNVLPPQWVFGLPIGNGQIGGMVWVEDGTKVVITLDHVWAWDLRQHPREDPDKLRFDNLVVFRGHLLRKDRLPDIVAGKIPIEAGFLTDILCSVDWSLSLPTKTHVGRVVIEFGKKISGSARLHLRDAQAVLEIRTESEDSVRLGIRADANLPAIVISHNCRDAIKDIRIERVSSDDLVPHLQSGEPIPEWYRLPDYERGSQGEIRWIRQNIPGSPSLAIALLPGDSQSCVTVQAARDAADPVNSAIEVLEQVVSTPEHCLVEHRGWWRRFWERSSLQYRRLKSNPSGTWGCTFWRPPAVRAGRQ